MRTSLALLVGLSLVACDGGGGDDESSETEESTAADEGWTTGDDGNSMLGSIEVTVEYAGEQTASLTVGAFPECPPVNPPVSFKRIDDATYPVMTTLEGIEPGDWCVYAYIDLPPENPTFPGDEDPQGFTEQVTLMGDVQSVTLTVTDP
jgi:hypothetical protein